MVWCLILTSKNYFIFSGLAIFVILVGFFEIPQEDIIINKKVVTISNGLEASKSIGNKKGRYSKSGLNKQASDKLYQSLMILIDHHKIYKKMTSP